MIKVIVFDFDGVLVDSNVLKKGAFVELFSDNPRVQAVAVGVLNTFWQKTRLEALREIFRKLGEDEGNTARLVNSYNERYNKIVIEKIANMGLIPGVLKALEELSKKYILYVNSATPTEPLLRTAKVLGIERFFKGICGVEGFAPILHSKKDNLEKIMKAENAVGDDVLFVGDGDADLAAAEEYNCNFIGIANQTNGWAGRGDIKTLLSVAEIPNMI